MAYRSVPFSLALICICAAPEVRAATFPVTTCTDTMPNAAGSPAGAGDGPGAVGDLRNTILLANSTGGANTITFSCPATPATITLGAPLPPITSDLTIDGGSFGNIVIDGNNSYRVFFADTGNITLANLRIQNAAATGGAGGSGAAPGGGGAGFGAGLFVNQSTAVITVRNTYFFNCSVTGGAGGAATPQGAGGRGGVTGPGRHDTEFNGGFGGGGGGTGNKGFAASSGNGGFGGGGGGGNGMASAGVSAAAVGGIRGGDGGPGTGEIGGAGGGAASGPAIFVGLGSVTLLNSTGSTF